ncbi:MAG TPA: Sua5/YciO/YrdC/YwlC family protein, partial [Atribacteraceae bacterium]|nr:Sua5/YciO/YrdC/YwlC family protein [Atribacteraceae bacterium]
MVKTRVLPADRAEHIREAAGILRAGGLVAFPTETVYGLGADARNERSAAGIFLAKDRPFFDPLIVHCTGTREVEGLVREFPARAQTLARRFWPGPLTLVLPKKKVI